MFKRILLLVMLCFGIIFAQSQPNLISDYVFNFGGNRDAIYQINPYNNKILVTGSHAIKQNLEWKSYYKAIQLVDMNNQEIIWRKALGDTTSDSNHSICTRTTVLPNGDIIVIYREDLTSEICYFERRDENGEIILQKKVPEEYEFYHANNYKDSIVTFKTDNGWKLHIRDKNGNLKRSIEIEGFQSGAFPKTIFKKDTVWLSGLYISTEGFHQYARAVIKMNIKTEEVYWRKNFEDGILPSIDIDKYDNTYLGASKMINSDGTTIFSLIKLDTHGNLLWTKHFSNVDTNYIEENAHWFHNVVVDNNSQYIAYIGSIYRNERYDHYAYIGILTPDGKILSQKDWKYREPKGAITDPQRNCVFFNKDNNLVLAIKDSKGFSYLDFPNQIHLEEYEMFSKPEIVDFSFPDTGLVNKEYDFGLLVSDPNKDSVQARIVFNNDTTNWSKTYKDSSNIVFKRTFSDTGKFSIQAQVKDKPKFSEVPVKYSNWIDLESIVIKDSTTDLVELPQSKAYKFKLCQNYPNPFNASTAIKFSIPKRSKVNLSIYDITGKRVETLIDGYKSKGRYEKVWNAKNLSSGVYFYKLQSQNKTITKKMILVK